ncbi:MAG: DUF234 domain-containing protein, partial [Clostridiales Family XIII bacterium]|nr:DUF234 domain-containing protein [Clostridiales Family XIII bacterium]
GRFTQIGRSWDTKGTNEIDIVALNTLDSKALIAEVKRDGHRINENILRIKAESLHHDLAGYEVEYGGFSLNNM